MDGIKHATIFLNPNQAWKLTMFEKMVAAHLNVTSIEINDCQIAASSSPIMPFTVFFKKVQ